MKKALALLLALMTALSLFAGGAGEGSSNDQIVIEFWTHEDVNRQALEDRYIQEFMAEHPNVTVNVTRQASTKLIELVQTAFAAGEGPTMFNLSISDEYPYIVAGRVAPMDYEAAGFTDAQSVKDAYLDGMIDPVTYDGEVYGLPLELTNWCIFINKKVFRDAGLDPETDYPRTWEDMVELSQKLVIRDGDILVRRGYDFRYPYYLETLVPMVEQLGGQLVSDDGTEAIIGEEAWIKVLTFMQQWGPNGLNLGSPTYTNARSLFNKDNNDIAMATTGLYQEARIKADNPEFYDSGEWMVVPFPVFEDAVNDVAACYYGHYYMVNGSISEAKQVWAWRLIDFMLSHSEGYLEKCSLVQPTYALFESELFKSMPYSEVFKNDLEHATLTYYSANSNAIRDKMKQAVEAVMLEGKDSQTVLEDFRRQVQDLLDDQNF